MINNFFNFIDKMINKTHYNNFTSSSYNNFNFETVNNEITINGQKYYGSSVCINSDGNIYIDGQKQDSNKTKNFTFEIIGDVKNIDCCNVNIHGNVNGNIDATNVNVYGNVIGDIDALNVSVKDTNKN